MHDNDTTIGRPGPEIPVALLGRGIQPAPAPTPYRVLCPVPAKPRARLSRPEFPARIISRPVIA
jgi:hypothetical protein